MEILHKEGEVMTCQAEECSYNQMDVCHAQKIAVGGPHAMCDTYTTRGATDLMTDAGSVGRCDILQCSFNDDRSCDASGITVGHHEQHADCMTYRA